MKKGITNLRNKHIVIAAFCLGFAFSILIPSSMDRLIYIGMFIMAFTLSTFYGTGVYEKADELAKGNLARAAKYAFILAVIALFVFSFLGSGAGDGSVYDDKVTVSSNIFAAVSFSVVAVRSILFVIFDISASKDTEEDE